MDNVNEAIYIGVSAMIFVIALSLTIFLFSSMMNYAEEAYDFMHEVSNNGAVINTAVNRYLVISSEDVVSYYYNYIQKDRFNNPDYNENIVVSINYKTKDETPVYLADDLTYEGLIDRIGFSNKFILNVEDNRQDGKTYINIIRATEQELEEKW